ncbi:MAG TPA: DUF2934 domain-containing protein [Thiobacillaceae bacterium]|nr:DUF2934 domain-containing protein [Thiobacillaceae bacterium]
MKFVTGAPWFWPAANELSLTRSADSNFINQSEGHMARKASALLGRVSRTEAAPEWNISAEERQRIIREAAYYHYLKRGFADGHDLEDWLAAEAEFDAMSLEPQVEMPEFEVQQSSVHGFRQDEALKRIVRRHPQRGIPQVEGIERKEAPAKE